MFQPAKKLASVLITSLLMIIASMEADSKVSILITKAPTTITGNSALLLKRVL